MTNIDDKVIADIISAIDASRELSKNVLGEIQTVRKMQEFQDDGEIDRMKDDIKSLNKIVKGNGEEGLVIKQTRIEERLKNIEYLIESIEEKLTNLLKTHVENINQNITLVKAEIETNKKNDIKVYLALFGAGISVLVAALGFIF